jgi:hypothetical protein
MKAIISCGKQEMNRMLRTGILPFARRRTSFVVFVVVCSARLMSVEKKVKKKRRRSKKKRIDEKVILVDKPEFEIQWGCKSQIQLTHDYASVPPHCSL